MIRSLIYRCLAFILIIFLSCNSSSLKEERDALEAYTSKEIGWTIEIPQGFKRTSQIKRDADDQKGKEAIEKVYEGELKIDSLRHLVSFMKNQFNSFDSTIEPYEETEAGEYAENNVLIHKLIFDTYHKQGIKIDTSSSKINLKGQLFNAFYIKIFGPNGEVALNQIMYSKMIKGYDFGVNINYNNEEDKNALISAFMNSNLDK